jgi:hypothetical protein
LNKWVKTPRIFSGFCRGVSDVVACDVRRVLATPTKTTDERKHQKYKFAPSHFVNPFLFLEWIFVPRTCIHVLLSCTNVSLEPALFIFYPEDGK